MLNHRLKQKTWTIKLSDSDCLYANWNTNFTVKSPTVHRSFLANNVEKSPWATKNWVNSIRINKSKTNFMCKIVKKFKENTLLLLLLLLLPLLLLVLLVVVVVVLLLLVILLLLLLLLTLPPPPILLLLLMTPLTCSCRSSWRFKKREQRNKLFNYYYFYASFVFLWHLATMCIVMNYVEPWINGALFKVNTSILNLNEMLLKDVNRNYFINVYSFIHNVILF